MDAPYSAMPENAERTHEQVSGRMETNIWARGPPSNAGTVCVQSEALICNPEDFHKRYSKGIMEDLKNLKKNF